MDINPEYDVVIVGAGPAGCTAAKYLSDKFSVLLIDRSKFPRDKPCGGLLVKESQHFIKQLEPLDFIFSKPRTLHLRLLDWDNDLDVKVGREYVNVIRDKFDYWLLQMIGSNVEFRPNNELLDFYKGKDHINVVIGRNNKTQIVKSKFLIGADGPASTVRKRLSHRNLPTYVAIQEKIKLDVDSDSYFIYDSEITDFYSWVIPKDGRVIVGAALPINNGNTREKFDLLKKKLSSKLGITGEYTNRESCLILRPQSTEDLILGSGNTFLAGEAAGFISPSTGEGISFALRSGYLCAHAINDLKDVQSSYSKLSQSLVDEISDKLLKSKALSNPESRKKVLTNWDLLSQPNAQFVAKQLWDK